jgi:hypothetical protein
LEADRREREWVEPQLGERRRQEMMADDPVTWSLAELRSAGLVVEVYSSLLDDSFLLASDDVEMPAEEAGAWYTVSETESLLGLAPEELKLIHEVKKRFRCTMTVDDLEPRQETLAIAS